MKAMKVGSKRVLGTFEPTPLARALHAVLVVGAIGAVSAPVTAAPDKPWKEGQILVKPKAGLSTEEFDGILQRGKAQSIGKIGNLPVHVRCVHKALRVCMGADALG